MNYNYLFRNDEYSELFSPTDGFNNGNMFMSLYNQYKNYKPTILKGNTKMENDYLELSRISFAMHEMNLYLDVHPEDRKILQLFNDYRKMFVELEKKYEENYGPLTVCSDSLNKNEFVWVKDAFPWEVDINV